jgi:hypothetical protein
MKKLIMILAFTLSLAAQTSTPAPAGEIYAGGVSYSPNAQQPLAVTGLAAHGLSDANTFAFVVADALPTNTKPLTISSNIGTGIAQKVATISGVSIYIPTAAGVSWTGKNTGWQWSSGAMAPIPLKGFLIMPNVRFLKSSVSNGSDYQVIFGIMFGVKR